MRLHEYNAVQAGVVSVERSVRPKDEPDARRDGLGKNTPAPPSLNKPRQAFRRAGLPQASRWRSYGTPGNVGGPGGSGGHPQNEASRLGELRRDII